MAKGDDALARKRNRVRRKRLRSSENAVSTRVAAIIASKRRRKAGKRRGCEGMCFSLPTPDDPFNERHGRKRKADEPDDDAADDAAVAATTTTKDDDNPNKKDAGAKRQQQPPAAAAKAGAKPKPKAVRERAAGAGEGRVDLDRPSKFLVVCLNAIRDAAAPEDGGIHGAGDWGVELWRCCSARAPPHVLDTSAACAAVEQTAWLVSTACDIVARKERLGMVVSCPFLLYLVPSQEKAAQVRSVCKPLKPLGIHSVSLHAGASIEHQISGLKTCEPEFLIATPERLLELVSLKAIDISSVSMLVIDGLKCFLDLNANDKICSIRDAISSDPQITIFTDPSDKNVASMAKKLLRGRITKLSINASVSARSAFIIQHAHFCPSEELKTSKVKEILDQILQCHAKKTSKVLLVAGSCDQAQHLSSSLKLGNCTVTDDSHGNSFTICSRYSAVSSSCLINRSCVIDESDQVFGRPISGRLTAIRWLIRGVGRPGYHRFTEWALGTRLGWDSWPLGTRPNRVTKITASQPHVKTRRKKSGQNIRHSRSISPPAPLRPSLHRPTHPPSRRLQLQLLSGSHSSSCCAGTPS